MTVYKFADIAFNSTEKKKPEPSDKDVYIGLEHLDPGILEVTRYGAAVAPKGDKLVMRKGDVLFGRRRAYQKKVAIAPFDGIFSAHGMVLRPRTEVVDPGFFPFFISSDCFLDEAIRVSVGSLSPTANWKDLKELSFDLPSLDEQREIAGIMRTAERAKAGYRALIKASDDLVKSRFIEMFGSLGRGSSRFKKARLDSIAQTRLGKMLDKKQQTGEHPAHYLANHNVQWFQFDLDELETMDFSDDDRKEFALRDGDLLMCEGGEVGRCAIWHNQLENCFFQKAIHRVRCDTNIVLPEYLAWHFKIAADEGLLVKHTNASTIAHLSGAKLKALQIVLPPIDDQHEFVFFSDQIDKSKFDYEMYRRWDAFTLLWSTRA